MNQDEENQRDVPDIPFSNYEQDEGNAKQELEGFQSESLQAEEIKNEHGRREKFRNVVHWVSISLVWPAAIVFLLIFLVWAWHLLAPDNWHYMAKDRVSDLRDMLSSAVIAVFVSDRLKKML